ncbi:MAG: hypothetical protein QNJ68_03465 [Microcoleaceae cyanobacterium MO_207.B10]|nr:hypothetical protein [Microcoleaceae cyanobacterium MO_207.B10]
MFLKTEVGKEVLEDGIYYYTIAIEKYPGENVKAVEIFSPKRIAMHGPNLEELKEYVRFNLVCLEGVKHE